MKQKTLIRPYNFNEFIGKKNIIDNINTFIKASQLSNKILDHILLYGLPGTGKTTIANIIANELKTKIKVIQGTHLKKNIDLINLISLVNEGDVIFIDEIHAMSLECIETLYSVMEDFSIDIMLGKDNESKSTRIELPKFTLIGATTSIGKLPKPLEERFEISFFFDNYEEEEIIKILKRNCILLELSLSDIQIEKIAHHSKGIPRIANKILKRVNDFIITDNNISIENILSKLKIYEYGLLEIDLIYLKALINQEQGLGIKTICSISQIDIKTIENNIEPFLLKSNLIIKNNFGRSLTQNGDILVRKIFNSI